MKYTTAMLTVGALAYTANARVARPVPQQAGVGRPGPVDMGALGRREIDELAGPPVHFGFPEPQMAGAKRMMPIEVDDDIHRTMPILPRNTVVTTTSDFFGSDVETFNVPKGQTLTTTTTPILPKRAADWQAVWRGGQVKAGGPKSRRGANWQAVWNGAQAKGGAPRSKRDTNWAGVWEGTARDAVKLGGWIADQAESIVKRDTNWNGVLTGTINDAEKLGEWAVESVKRDTNWNGVLTGTINDAEKLGNWAVGEVESVAKRDTNWNGVLTGTINDAEKLGDYVVDSVKRDTNWNGVLTGTINDAEKLGNWAVGEVESVAKRDTNWNGVLTGTINDAEKLGEWAVGEVTKRQAPAAADSHLKVFLDDGFQHAPRTKTRRSNTFEGFPGLRVTGGFDFEDALPVKRSNTLEALHLHETIPVDSNGNVIKRQAGAKVTTDFPAFHTVSTIPVDSNGHVLKRTDSFTDITTDFPAFHPVETIPGHNGVSVKRSAPRVSLGPGLSGTPNFPKRSTHVTLGDGFHGEPILPKRAAHISLGDGFRGEPILPKREAPFITLGNGMQSEPGFYGPK